jgi:crotonobetainyl-CoA:carnitine CoA-transferase CaiB-like acyl-CoA transferase
MAGDGRNAGGEVKGLVLNQPLSGIKVLDLTQIYQGPYAAFLFASAGADVIKVEPVAGERLRGPGGPRTPLSFAMLNSNKKSITLNLQTEEGQDLLKQLVEIVDVLLENYAPEVMDRLGLGWDALKQLNPRLVYCSGTGYGLSGPDRDTLAMDHTIQAASGLMSVTGDEDSPPSRAGGTPCDIMGGIHMYAGALAALQGRATSGLGTRVEISMLESMYFTLASELSILHSSGETPPRNSARSPSNIAPYGRYPCKDGWIAIMCVAESHWHGVLSVIGHESEKDNHDYRNSMARKKREHLVDAMINEWSVTQTREEAYEKLRAKKVPVAPIRSLQEVQSDPHLHERGMLYDKHHSELGDVTLPTSPIRFSEYDLMEPGFYPELGEHNEQVYGTLGLAAEMLSDLKKKGVI